MKNWKKSWTIWVNLAALLGIAAIEFLSEQGLTGTWIAPTLAVLNIALRFKTTEQLKIGA